MSKAGPLWELTDCIVNKLNMSQIWLPGFAVTNHYCNHSSNFFEKRGTTLLIAKLIITFFLTIDFCLKSHWWLTPSTQKKDFWLYHLFSDVTAQPRWRLSIWLWAIASCHLMQRKNWDDIWLPGADSFPTVCNTNDFEAINFRRYTRIVCLKIEDHNIQSVWTY